MEKTLEGILFNLYRLGFDAGVGHSDNHDFDDVEEVRQAIRALLKEKMPAKAQTRATHTGAGYESEWDEGFNNCLSEMQKVIDSL